MITYEKSGQVGIHFGFIHGGFKHGLLENPQIMENSIQMDDDWGYPHDLGNPPIN